MDNQITYTEKVDSTGGGTAAETFRSADANEIKAKHNALDAQVQALVLTDNNYTSAEKAKLAGLAAVAASGAYADLSGKPDLSGYATTGAVAANTAAIEAARTTQVATTEQTGAYTLVLSDAGNVVPVAAASGVAVTVPPNASVAFPVGTVVNIIQSGAGQLTITAGGGVTIRQADSQFKTAKQWAEVSLRKRATNEWVLVGYTAA